MGTTEEMYADKPPPQEEPEEDSASEWSDEDVDVIDWIHNDEPQGTMEVPSYKIPLHKFRTKFCLRYMDDDSRFIKKKRKEKKDINVKFAKEADLTLQDILHEEKGVKKFYTF